MENRDLLQREDTGRTHQYSGSSYRPALARMGVSQSAARVKSYLHWVNNTLLLRAFVKKERSQTQAEIQKWASSSLYPSRQSIAADRMVRSHRNPADHYSRRIPQRPNQGAMKKCKPKAPCCGQPTVQGRKCSKPNQCGPPVRQTVSSFSPQALQPRRQHILCWD